MRLRMPAELTLGRIISTLDDNRVVTIDGDGVICAYRPGTYGTGTEYCRLVLPAIPDSNSQPDQETRS